MEAAIADMSSEEVQHLLDRGRHSNEEIDGQRHAAQADIARLVARIGRRLMQERSFRNVLKFVRRDTAAFRICGVVAVCLAASQATIAKSETFPLVNNQSSVTEATGWSRQDFDLFDNASLNRDGCEFFSAASRRVLDAPVVDFAKLTDGNVVNTFENGSLDIARTIVDACGAGASADWWAEIIVRFSGRITGQLVRTGDAHAIREIERQVGVYERPVILEKNGQKHVSFYTFDYEIDSAFMNSIDRSPQGYLNLSSRRLGK